MSLKFARPSGIRPACDTGRRGTTVWNREVVALVGELRAVDRLARLGVVDRFCRVGALDRLDRISRVGVLDRFGGVAGIDHVVPRPVGRHEERPRLAAQNKRRLLQSPPARVRAGRRAAPCPWRCSTRAAAPRGGGRSGCGRGGGRADGRCRGSRSCRGSRWRWCRRSVAVDLPGMAGRARAGPEGRTPPPAAVQPAASDPGAAACSWGGMRYLRVWGLCSSSPISSSVRT